MLMGSQRDSYTVDFDGVVSENQPEHGPVLTAYERLVPVRVARLSAFVERTGCRVVVSSTWRYTSLSGLGMRATALESCLRSRGYTGRVHDITPAHAEVEWVDELAKDRGGEILAWCRAQPVKPRAIVALDDVALVGPIAPYLVQTEERVGLTDADVERAVAMLSRPIRGRRPWSPPAPAPRASRSASPGR